MTTNDLPAADDDGEDPIELIAAGIASNAEAIGNVWKALVIAAGLSLVVALMVGAGGWLVLEDREERRREEVQRQEDRRREICDNVKHAFDAYTDALAEISGASPERVATFRDAYEPRLAKCD